MGVYLYELSWILDDPMDDRRVTSRGPSSRPECLTLNVRVSSDFGATNEITTLALLETAGKRDT